MNILIIGTTDILGGAAKVSWQLKEYLQKGGHTVSMFVADKRSDDPTVHVIPRSFIRKLAGFVFATENFINTDWILKTEEFKQADIIHCHNLHGRFFNLRTLQKMSLLKPVMWTLHDEWALTPHCAYTLQGTAMKNGLYVCPSKDTQPRILWDNTTHLAAEKNDIYAQSKLTVITPSHWLEERARATSLSAQKIIHIPNGIDTEIFSPGDKTEARKKLGLPLDKKILLFLANDARKNTWKGWVYAEKVIANLKDDPTTVCVCVGDHMAADEEKSAGNIINRGYIKNSEEIRDYYRAADGLLFTSLAENFPLVILEAMSCGLPIVSFDIGGVAEAVTHMKNGYISAYCDSDALTAGAQWLLKLSPIERQAMGIENSKKVRESFTQEQMYEKYMKVYNELDQKK